jgi:integrase
MSHSGNNTSLPISAYYTNGTCHHVYSSHINHAVKHAAAQVGLPAKGYNLKDVSSHSLRAGGAMALKLHGCDRDTIKKLGRWSSDTFLTYIHEQISAFTTGLSTLMATPISFHNMMPAHTTTPIPAG